MDQKKIGSFLKSLRKEKEITQEKLSEYFNVSSRTVSRWETGSNMPDLQILIEMSDFYDVDIRELIDGERKSERMNKELEETAEKIVNYSNEEKLGIIKKMNKLFIFGFTTFVIYFIMLFVEPVNKSNLYEFISGLLVGVPFGSIIVGIILTSKYANKILKFKKNTI